MDKNFAQAEKVGNDILSLAYLLLPKKWCFFFFSGSLESLFAAGRELAELGDMLAVPFCLAWEVSRRIPAIAPVGGSGGLIFAARSNSLIALTCGWPGWPERPW